MTKLNTILNVVREAAKGESSLEQDLPVMLEALTSLGDYEGSPRDAVEEVLISRYDSGTVTGEVAEAWCHMVHGVQQQYGFEGL